MAISRFWAVTTLFLGFLATTGGCELVAQVDRSKIGGSGGTSGTSGTSGSGGAAGHGGTTGHGGAGGAGGAACTDPAADCPDPMNECVVATCEVAGACGTMNVAEGVKTTANQVVGDCKQRVCDGKGATTIVDASDPTDDANDCTTDTCNAGANVHTDVAPGGACAQNGGKVCGAGTKSGQCVGCLVNADCADPASPTCDTKNDSFTCVPATCANGVKDGAETGLDCGGGPCSPCADGEGCLVAGDCTSNLCKAMICAACTGDGDCAASDFCDLGTGDCTGDKGNGGSCTSDAQCANGHCVDGFCCDTTCTGTCDACAASKKGQGLDGTCGPIVGGADPDDECAADPLSTCGHTGACGGSSACQLYAVGSVCAAQVCAAGVQQGVDICNGAGTCVDGGAVPCAPYTCNAAGVACLVTCSVDTECAAGSFCNGGACVAKLGSGTACAGQNQCTSGSCVDGVCCASACGGTCQACNVAGNLGTCVSVPSGQQDLPTCGGTSACDGAGACLQQNGTACALGQSCLSGACVDGVCCDGACGGLCQACNVAGSVGTCANVPSLADPAGECPGATSCNGAGACALFTNGAGCAAGNECSSGTCIDGVCCNVACGGLCQACNLAGSAGTCTSVSAGADPANECADPYACGGGGACQTCGDGVKNGNETGVDCGGGGGCAACANGQTCLVNGDCLTSTCTAGTCVAAPNPHYAVGGTVNAVLHAGTAFYLGGTFERISKIPASNLLVLDATGATAGCSLGTSFDGVLSAMAVSGNAIYVGGFFTHYKGALANHLAKIDATTCALDTTFSPPGSNGPDGNVIALAVSGGSLYVGGQFTTYKGGTSANRIAKLDLASGALDLTFSPAASNGFDGNVAALAVSGTSLYVAGAFNTYRGVASSAAKLAKLDLTTGAIDTTFSPVGANANGFDQSTSALATSATSLYVGGFFTAYRGVVNSARRIAKLDLTSGAIDTTFSPVGASSNGFDDVVQSLAVSGTSVYAGGRFANYRGVASSSGRIAKLDATTGAIDTVTFNPGGAGFAHSSQVNVTALATSGATLYVGGTFTTYDGQTANGIAALNATTGALNQGFLPADSNTPGVSGGVAPNFPTVTALAIVGANVWVGGRFTVYGGYSANNVARIDDITGVVDTTFSPVAANGFDSTVSALASDGTSLFVGGAFTAYRGTANAARRLAKIDLASGAIDTTFSPVGASANGFDATVSALAVSGASLYAGGSFTAYKGVASSANRLARLTIASGAIDTTFSPVGAAANGFDAAVTALTVSGTSLYAGGSFTAYKGVASSANRIAMLDLTTGAQDATFSPAASNGFDATVSALVASGSSIYAGGSFTAYRGVAGSATRVAKLDRASGDLDTTFSPAASNGFDGAVLALTVSGSSLYAGGSFTAYRGVAASAQHLAKLDLGSGALDTVFSPAASNGTDGDVSGLGVNGTVLVVGGSFTVYQNSTTLKRALLALDPTTGVEK